MKLHSDDILQVYVWVDDDNEDEEISPRFDYEEDAILWKQRLEKKLNENS